MSKKKWIRVISDDGTLATTEILDDEGETIDHVYRVDLHLDARAKGKGMWHAELYSYMPMIDVRVEAHTHTTCPYCGQEIPEPFSTFLRVQQEIRDLIPQIGTIDNDEGEKEG